MNFAEHVAKGRQKHFPQGHHEGAHRHAFHHARTSLGAAGHFIHLATVGAPLIIGEMVKDPEKRWRYAKLATFGAALASEAAWTIKVAHDRHREQQLRDQLETVSARSSPPLRRSRV